VNDVTSKVEEIDARAPEKKRIITDERTNKKVWASPAEFSAKDGYVDRSGEALAWESSATNTYADHQVLAKCDLLDEIDRNGNEELFEPPSAPPQARAVGASPSSGPCASSSMPSRPRAPLALTDGPPQSRMAMRYLDDVIKNTVRESDSEGSE
jgi:hypothetical protein